MNKSETEKIFMEKILKVGIERYGNCNDNNKTYWFFDLKNGGQRFWTDLSEENQKKLEEENK